MKLLKSEFEEIIKKHGMWIRGEEGGERADLREADLRGTNLYGTEALTVITPEGSLIGWKKCRSDVIVKLRIPEEARRSNAAGRKCRAEFADVLEVIGGDVGISQHDGTTARQNIGWASALRATNGVKIDGQNAQAEYTSSSRDGKRKTIINKRSINNGK